jgi:methylenetetrahydrofolate reductase (NADPH)
VSRRLDAYLRARPALERRLNAVGLLLEDLVKVPVFRCQRCGECVLSHTAFVCSQRCPKRLRNGACGGTRPGGHCEVHPERRCIWYCVYSRSRALGRAAMLTERITAHQWSLERTSAWLSVFRGRIAGPQLLVGRVAARLDARTARRALEEREP